MTVVLMEVTVNFVIIISSVKKVLIHIISGCEKFMTTVSNKYQQNVVILSQISSDCGNFRARINNKHQQNFMVLIQIISECDSFVTRISSIGKVWWSSYRSLVTMIFLFRRFHVAVILISSSVKTRGTLLPVQAFLFASGHYLLVFPPGWMNL